MRRIILALTVLLLLASLVPSLVRADHRDMGWVDEKGRLPIVYVHGYNSSGCYWDYVDSVRFHLEQAGHPRINPQTKESVAHAGAWLKLDPTYAEVRAENAGIVNYGNADCNSGERGDDDSSEGDFTSYKVYSVLDEAILEAHKSSPTGYVDLVAHSMGGLVSRYYLNNGKYRHYVRSLVMIGTPNHGSFGSLATRLAGLFSDLDWYRLDQARIDHWAKLYRVYADQNEKQISATDPAHQSFFQWLAANHAGELDAFRSNSVEYSTKHLEKRYTPQFEELLMLVKGKADARKTILSEIIERAPPAPYDPFIPIDTSSLPDETETDTTTEGKGAVLFGVRWAASADWKAIAIDRLLPEYVPALVGVDERGQLRLLQIPTNPALLQLNAMDQYRANHNARYIMIAGVARGISAWQTGLSTYFSGKLGTYPIAGNDSIVEWHSVLLPMRGTDKYYVYEGGGEAEHTAMTRENRTTRQWVLNELDGKNYFSPVQAATLNATQAFARNWTVQSGGTVMLELERGQPDFTAGNRLLLFKTSSPAEGAPSWVFLEEPDGTIRYDLMRREDLHTRYWAGEVSQYRRVGVVTPNARPGAPRPAVQVSAQYDSGTAIEAAIRRAAGRYELSISQIDATRYPVISAYISVRDKFEGPVNDLRASDFWVEDSGIQVANHQIFPVSERFARKDKNVALVLDYSGSMEGMPLRLSQEAAKLFIGGLAPRDKVAVARFSTEPQLLQELTGDFATAQSKVTGNAGGGTNLYGSALFGINQVKSATGRRAVILFSDGLHNAGNATPNQVISAARAAGVSVYSIGLGKELNTVELERIARETGGKVHYAPDANQLARLYDSIAEQVASEYRVIYLARPSAEPTRTLAIGLNRSNAASDQKTYQTDMEGER